MHHRPRRITRTTIVIFLALLLTLSVPQPAHAGWLNDRVAGPLNILANSVGSAFQNLTSFLAEALASRTISPIPGDDEQAFNDAPEIQDINQPIQTTELFQQTNATTVFENNTLSISPPHGYDRK